MQLSITAIKAFKACRRMYYLRYVEGLKPVTKPEALEVGTNYHKLLESLYSGDLDALQGTTREHAMAQAYHKYIYPRFKVTAAEKRLEYNLGDGDVLTGIVDGIAADGCIVEHKTTSQAITPAYEYNLLWDEQILAYMLLTGARKVWYTVCQKPTIRQKKGETDEEYFERMCAWYDEDTETKITVMQIERTDAEVEAFRKQLETIKGTIHEAENDGNYYINTCHCNAWGRRCEYSSICLNYDPEAQYLEYYHYKQ